MVGRESGWIDRCFDSLTNALSGVVLKERERHGAEEERETGILFCAVVSSCSALSSWPRFPARVAGDDEKWMDGWMVGWRSCRAVGEAPLVSPGLPYLPGLLIGSVVSVFFFFFLVLSLPLPALFSLSALVWGVLSSLSRARGLWSLVFGLGHDRTGLDWTGTGIGAWEWAWGSARELYGRGISRFAVCRRAGY